MASGKAENNPPDNSPLHRAAAQWPTATAEDAESSQARRPADVTLTEAAKLWATPKAPTGGSEARASREARGSGGEDVGAQAINWPTPTPTEAPNTNANQKNMPPSLGKAAAQWVTPTEKDGLRPSPTHKNLSPTLTGQACFPQVQPSWPSGSASLPSDPTSRQRRKLNPLFVEWLMGWPVGWTSLAPLGSGSRATEWFRSRRLLLGALSGEGSY